MNSIITFPSPLPELKLTRNSEKWAATLAEERRRLIEDQDALREREANLRDYEERLRAWQAEIDAGLNTPPAHAARAASVTPFHRPSSRTPFAEDPALQAAWEKLHRARELLEAEQTHMRNDRIQMHDQQEILKRREAELAEREARVAEREKLVAEALVGPESIPHAIEPPPSAVSRLTRAPFEMARSVFGGKK